MQESAKSRGTVTTLKNRPNTALLVIDVQRGVVENAFERDRVIANINALVDKARAEHVALVWIQHSDEQLERGSDRWRLADELHPDPSEPLVEKHYGDSFEDTELENVLADLGVGRVVVTGAQTDACIAQPSTVPSLGDTTHCWSVTRTRLRTPHSGALPRPTR